MQKALTYWKELAGAITAVIVLFLAVESRYQSSLEARIMAYETDIKISQKQTEQLVGVLKLYQDRRIANGGQALNAADEIREGELNATLERELIFQADTQATIEALKDSAVF